MPGQTNPPTRCTEQKRCKKIPRHIIWILVYLSAIAWMVYSLYADISTGQMWLYIVLYALNMCTSAVSMITNLKLSTSILLYAITAFITITLTTVYMEWYIPTCLAGFYLIILLLHCNWCCDVQSTFYPESVIHPDEDEDEDKYEDEKTLEVSDIEAKLKVIIVRQPGKQHIMVGTENIPVATAATAI